MRQSDEMGWYKGSDPDGNPVTVHGIKSLMPEDAVEITEAEARQISTERRANAPKPLPQSPISAQIQASVDLQPLFDKIDALSKTVISQAQALDEANAKLESQSEDIAKFKQNTVAAIAQMGAGIGSAQA